MSHSFDIKNTILQSISLDNDFNLPIFNALFLNDTPIGSLTGVNIGDLLTWNGIEWTFQNSLGSTGPTGYTGVTGPTGIIGPTGSITDYLVISKNNNQNLVGPRVNIEWDNIEGTIDFISPSFILEKGKTYLINCEMYCDTFTNATSGFTRYGIVDSFNNSISKYSSLSPVTSVINSGTGGGFNTIITPNITQEYKFQTSGTSDGTCRYRGTTGETPSCQCTIVKIL
jgi:hypothetical protein